MLDLQPRATLDPRNLDLHDLVVRVIGRYHDHLRRTLPDLRELAAEVARVDGPAAPQLIAVAILVDKLVELLLDHMTEEETELFPDLLADPIPARVGAALAHREEEHEAVRDRFVELREVAGHYLAPDGCSASCRTLMVELATLEGFQRRHDRLEHDVLIPRVLRAQAVR
jgi:regulator of cell morphogenesis and NO signaling